MTTSTQQRTHTQQLSSNQELTHTPRQDHLQAKGTAMITAPDPGITSTW